MRDPELSTMGKERRTLLEEQQVIVKPDAKDPHRHSASPQPSVKPNKPARTGRLALIGIILVVFIAGMFAAGYLPRIQRERALSDAVAEKKVAVPEVNVASVRVSPSHDDLLLPGNITPLTEAIIHARADGYLIHRYVDFGDRVKAGQVLADIEAPELDQQVQQARANVSQSHAALSRSQHVLVQANANLHLSEVTVQRWKTLVDRGVVSKQEYDQQEANYEAQKAAVNSAEADIRAAEENVAASQANLDRLLNLQLYKKVVAPFDGIITARNVDIGSLISSNGNTPMFRMAQIDVLRILVDVPEQSAPFIKVGEPAEVTLQEFPDRKFLGRVSRTTNSLEASTRTLQTEVQVQNRDGALMPNMFVQVNLVGARTAPSVIIPGDALIVHSNGPEVAVVDSHNQIHLRPIQVGRDYGAELEVRSGLSGNESVVVNPNDDVREGAIVEPVRQKEAEPRAGASGNRKAGR